MKERSTNETPKLADLNLIDDFLFGSMVTHHEVGERFNRTLLEIILGHPLGRLNVIPQKVYYGNDLDKHGVRLDVFLEELPDGEEDTATVYDIEPEKGKNRRRFLPQRARFYHSKITSDCLDSGHSYDSLKRAVVIIITPFDPFERNRMVYTCRTKCEEEPDMAYDDGAVTIYLNTKGEPCGIRKELKELLFYFEHTTAENAVNPTLKEIEKMAEKVKYDVVTSMCYLRYLEEKRETLEEGIEIGREEGREQERVHTLEAQQEIKRLKDLLKSHNIEA